MSLAPRQTLRSLFALSCFCCCVVAALFIQGRAQATPAFWGQTLLVSAAWTVLACALCFRRGGLAMPAVPWGVLGWRLLRELLVAYGGLALLMTTGAWLALMRLHLSAAQGLALAVVAGLWLAL